MSKYIVKLMAEKVKATSNQEVNHALDFTGLPLWDLFSGAVVLRGVP